MTRLLLTPVKNEAALLGAFLDHHAPLFDRILIADQGSTDGSWDIVSSHPKVLAIRNASSEFNELERRHILLEEARKIDSNALLVGLDADEFLLTGPSEWSALCIEWSNQSPNFAVRLPWMCLTPGGRDWFNLSNIFCRTGYGGLLPNSKIHVPRVPIGPAPTHQANIPVLHLNFFWPRRQQMKTWWYSALETKMFGAVSIDARRLYRHSGTGSMRNLQPVPEEWTKPVSDILSRIALADSWDSWHKERLLEMLQNDSDGRLRHAPIWGYPWRCELFCAGRGDHPGPSLVGRLADWWIEATNDHRKNPLVRAVDSGLRHLPPFRPIRSMSPPSNGTGD